MIRNGHRLNRQTMEAYWLALNDQLEREVQQAPKSKDLEKEIIALEERLKDVPDGEDKIDLALEIGRGTP